MSQKRSQSAVLLLAVSLIFAEGCFELGIIGNWVNRVAENIGYWLLFDTKVPSILQGGAAVMFSVVGSF